MTEFVFVLNNNDAVRAFSREGNVTIGANVSAAGARSGGICKPRAAIYTYSPSKGLFAGASLQGAVIATQKDSNARYYGRPIRSSDILSGRVPPPKGAARLLAQLRR